MRRLALLLGLLLALVCHAQVNKDSLPTEVINGQKVYRYEVQKSEGLYRICKNFGIQQQDLLNLNPSLEKEGLKVGQKILIPVVEKLDSTQYVLHTLKPKETLYGLGKTYGVRVEDIVNLNPVTSQRMEIGKTLLIKKKELLENAVVKEPSATKDIEPVKELPVVKDKPMAVEQPAKEIGVKENLTKAVPVQELKKAEGKEGKDLVAEVQEETIVVNPTEFIPEMPTISPLPLRIAYMLPMMVNATKRDANMDRFVDFYEGSLIAIYEAQQRGQKFEVYTYDVQKSEVHAQQAIENGALQNVDVIIGPAYPTQVNIVGMYAKNNRIPVLVPFTSRVSALDVNPYLMQFNPSAEAEAKALVDELIPRKDSIQFVLVDATNGELAASVLAFRKAIHEAEFSEVSVSINQILNDSLTPLLAPDKENIIVFPSEKWSAAQVLMPKILSQKAGQQLTIYGHHAWASETVLLPMIYASIFHEIDSHSFYGYKHLYELYFGHELSSTNPRYDLLGYDMTKAMITYLQLAHQVDYEAERDAIYSQLQKGIQSDIALPRVHDRGGKMNTAIHIYRK